MIIDIDQDLEDDLYRFGEKLGIRWANEISKMVENTKIPIENVRIILPVEKLATYEKLPMSKRMIMSLGSETFGVMSNTMILGSAVVTCGMSGIRMTTTINPTAKFFYGLSCAFSGTSAASGSMAVLARKGQISEVAMLTEAFGAAFLYLGNQAHAAALKVEGRPIPTHYRRRPVAGFGLYHRKNDAAFITPFKCSRIIETIPFEQIGRTIGFSISIYCYGKILLRAYRYGQQFLVKYKHKKLLKSTKLFISLISIQSAKRRRLYQFVVS